MPFKAIASPRHTRIGRHLSESDICPKAELGISDRCRCRTGVVFGDICPNFGSYCNLGSHSHFTSYELAIHNAVASVWPSTTRRGCNFHYKKALLKHVKQTNIWEEYLTPNSPVRDFFAMTGAIAYVPETDVPRIWRHLKPLLPIDMAEFASYYENIWIGTSTTNPNFAPHMWNQHEAAQMRIPRSSNIAEGWHHGFHSMLSCSKPTIWKFLDCLKAEQALTDVKKTKRDGRELPEPRAPKWIRYDRQLQRIVDDYDNYSNPMDFLKAIGNLTML